MRGCYVDPEPVAGETPGGVAPGTGGTALMLNVILRHGQDGKHLPEMSCRSGIGFYVEAPQI